MSEHAILARLQAEGLRLTEPRRQVVQAIVALGRPFSAEELYHALQAANRPVGRATVFRTIDRLVAIGVLARVHHPSGVHRYLLRGTEHRHHIVCVQCGTVAEFSGCNVDALGAAVVAQTRFRVDGHWLELFGLCARCQQEHYPLT